MRLLNHVHLCIHVLLLSPNEDLIIIIINNLFAPKLI